MPTYVDRPLCSAVVLDPHACAIRRCRRTALDGDDLCEKHRPAAKWQRVLQAALRPGWDRDGADVAAKPPAMKPLSTPRPAAASSAAPAPVAAPPAPSASPAPAAPAPTPVESAADPLSRFLRHTPH